MAVSIYGSDGYPLVSSSVNSRRARGMLLAAKSFYIGGAKPYDCEVEYLESNGNASYAYILIPVTGDGQSWDIECDYMVNSSGRQYGRALTVKPSDSSGGEIILRSAQYASYYEWLAYKGGASIYALRNGSVFTGIRYKQRIVCNGLKFSSCLNGILKDGDRASTGYPVGSCRVGLFQPSTTYTAENLIGRIYGAKVASNGVNLLDLTPVKGKDGKGYMYNKVDGELHGNYGTGSFTLGPKV